MIHPEKAKWKVQSVWISAIYQTEVTAKKKFKFVCFPLIFSSTKIKKVGCINLPQSISFKPDKNIYLDEKHGVSKGASWLHNIFVLA